MRFTLYFIALFLLTATNSYAQCTIAIDSVTQTNVLCNGQSNGAITVYTSRAQGAVTYSNGSGTVISPEQTFSSSSSISNTTPSPTNRWWTPSSCTGNSTWIYSSTLGCTPGSAVFNGNGAFSGCFLRSPELNMNGVNRVTITFDLSHSYNASRPNDRMRFYIWVNGTYTAVPVVVNGVSGNTGSYYLNFDQLRTCVAMTVTLDLSAVPVNGRSDFMLYIETSCGYNTCAPYQAIVDNIEISGGAPGQSSNTFTGLPAGTYPITVTDSAGCSVTLASPVVITQPNTLTATTTGSNVTCNNLCNGTATTNPNGGTGPYTYRWNTSPQQTTQTIGNLCPGSYIVTVTDANGCTTTTSKAVLQPTVLSATVTAAGATTIGGCNGSATANVTGGTTSYTYLWNTNPVQSTVTAQNVCAGTYCVTVTDANGCITSACGTVTQPTCNLNLNLVQDSVECNGNSDGAITATASLGMQPYQYKLNGGSFQSSGTFSGLNAGSYTVIALDNLGCLDTTTISVLQPVALSGSVTTTAATTVGGTDGTATVSVAGGSFPFTYLWNTNPMQTTATATGLPTGNYCVTVSDVNGCTDIFCGTVGQPGACGINLSLVQDSVSCSGGSNDGSITATVTGGIAPYQYKLNNGSFQGSNVFSNLAAGSYMMIVQDNVGCRDTASISVLQTAPLSITLSSTDVSAAGAIDGTAAASVSGGHPPYTYYWSSSAATTASIGNLGAGQYCVTVTDANGCDTSKCVTVTSFSPVGCAGLVIDNVSYQDNECSGMLVPNITVTAHTANGIIAYSIDNGTTTQPTGFFDNLSDGLYYIQVSDDSNCVVNYANNPVVINPWQQIQPVINYNSATNTLSTDALSDYDYQWYYNGIGIDSTNSNTYTPTANGDYFVTISSIMGCFGSSDTISININTVEEFDKLQLAIYPNPFEDELNIQLNGNSKPVKMELYNILGRRLIDESFNGSTFSISTDNLSQGVYVVRLTIGTETFYRQIVKQ